MNSEPLSDLLATQEVEGVLIVRFTRRTILDPMVIETVGEHLLGLVENHGATRLVLNYNHVESMTSAMLGKLVSLFNAIEVEGGRLVFCNVDPFLRTIFTICKLPPSIEIHADEQAALASFKVTTGAGLAFPGSLSGTAGPTQEIDPR